LITDSGEIGPRSRPYQPEAFEPSAWAEFFCELGTKKSLSFFSFFAQPPCPLAKYANVDVLLQFSLVQIYGVSNYSTLDSKKLQMTFSVLLCTWKLPLYF
jgi:hypothetical protein